MITKDLPLTGDYALEVFGLIVGGRKFGKKASRGQNEKF